MSKIIRMGRRRADVLVRMKSEIKDLNIKDQSHATVLVPIKRALLIQRFGRYVNVRDNKEATELFPAFNIYPLPADSISKSEDFYEGFVNNQNQVDFYNLVDNKYRLDADFNDLEEYEITEGDGKYFYVALAVETGLESIEDVKIGGIQFDSSAEAEADGYGLPKGSFVAWLRLGQRNENILLEYDGGESVIEIEVIDTNVVDIEPPYLVSAIVNITDGEPVEFDGRSITLIQGSVSESIEGIISVPVKLVGTPKVKMLVDEEWVDYGTVAVSEEDDRVVIVTPIGSNGNTSDLGEFTFKFPEGAFEYRAVGNNEELFTLTVVEPENNEE